MRKNQKIVNLFEDKNVYNIKHIISISCEDDLNHFWDFLNNLHDSNNDIIQTFLSQFYSISLSYMLKKDTYYFEITLEDSEKYFYFSIFNKQASSIFKKYAKKMSLNFIRNENSLSIKLDKKAFEENIKKIDSKNIKRKKNLLKSVESSKPITQKKAYNFLEHTDLEELLAQSDDMLDLIKNAKTHNLNEMNFITLRSTLSLFAQTLRYYERIVPFSTTITNFSNLLNVNKDKFIKLDKYQLSLIEGFIYNIDYWLHTLFIHGGANLYFMDNSIKADYETISIMINPLEYRSYENSLDSIFNF